MSDEPQSFAFLLLCRDLLLSSKVMATARASDVTVKQIRSAEALGASSGLSSSLIVDLNEPGFLNAAADWKAATNGRVIAFAGHADAAAFAGARAAALDKAFARGVFVASLEAILKDARP